MSQPQFVIKTEEIREEGKSYDFAVTSAWVDSALSDVGLRGDASGPEGHLAVAVHQTGGSGSGEMAVSGRLTARVVAECGRCLGDVPVDASVRVRLVLSPLSDRHELPEELELTPEDLERDYYDGISFSLDAFVRESLLLEVPMQPLCDEACEGIEIPKHVQGPELGKVNLEGAPAGMDARLAPLLELKRALGESAESAAPQIPDPKQD